MELDDRCVYRYQPDFTWLKPYEEKTFKQYFMPYKAAGVVKNATIDAAVNMTHTQQGVEIIVYADFNLSG